MGGQLLNQRSALQPWILSLAYILNVVPTRIGTTKSNVHKHHVKGSRFCSRKYNLLLILYTLWGAFTCTTNSNRFKRNHVREALYYMNRLNQENVTTSQSHYLYSSHVGVYPRPKTSYLMGEDETWLHEHLILFAFPVIWSDGARVEQMICMHRPPFWGRIKFIQTAPRMAPERLNMHGKKVKNAVWLGVRGSH